MPMLERPPILVPKAAVATAHPLATSAALEMMQRGGSAADAAVAAGAVLCVVEPWASHVGGDAFALLWDATGQRARAIQGSGIAPRACEPTSQALRDGVPLRGGGSVAVPGLVGAWFHLLETRGRLPVAEVFARAIDLAAGGFPADRRWERVRRLQRETIRSDAGLLDLMGSDDQPVRQGERIRQPELAETLRGLARDGAAFLYEGPLGARIVEEVCSRGGCLAKADLSGHRTEEVEPLAAELAGVELLEQPPVSQGAMVIAAMRALEATDRKGWRIEGDEPRAAAREIHLQVEIYRRVRAYRDVWLCDPRFATAEQRRRFDHWLSPEHAAGTVEKIDPLRPVPISVPPPRPEVRDTTYFCVADPDGNIVSWIQSIFHPFGAGFIVPGSGVLLNNRMFGFSPDPSSPNRLEPGKRTVHTLNSWIVLRGGLPWLVGGTPGGERQIQTNVQVLRGRLARSFDLATAIHAPRWMMDEKDRLAIEGRGRAEVRHRVARIGHETVRIGPWQGSGYVQALERLEGGGWLAATDPRGDGLTAGF